MSVPKLERIDGFQSPNEYEQFILWIAEHIKEGSIEEIPAGVRYAGATVFDEKWFRLKKSKEVWRLVAPDFPFRGIFDRIT